ncbi:MAG: hypothetical protein AAFR91_11985 [Pseudomonadota bacterium]
MKKQIQWAALVALGCVMAVGAPASVNKSIKIEAGATSDGASTVNGKVSVGDGAIITGDVESVNGTVRIGSGVQAEAVDSVNGRVSVGDDSIVASVQTVNGRNEIGERVRIAGDVSTVNGQVSIEQGSTVGGDVDTVNGKIQLTGVVVSGDIGNTNGGVYLDEGTRVSGSVVVRKTKSYGWSWGKKERSKPIVVIGRNVVVEGPLIFEREVELYVHETAQIAEVQGKNIEMQRYSGDKP